MAFDWTTLSPKQFEELCCLILEANEFNDIQWFGESGGDKGRDIVAKKLDKPLPGIQKHTTWVVQCKRYLSKPPTKDDLFSFLNSAREHAPDNVLFIVTNTLSSNVKDWLAAVKGDYRFDIYLWELRDLEREIHANRHLISSRMPGLFRNEDPIRLYERKSYTTHFGCNEFEEVEITVVNHAHDLKEAKRLAEEFLAYVRQNGFDWWK